MNSITLHQIDDNLYKSLVSDAREKGQSLNATAKKRLGEVYGLGEKKKKYRDLSFMVGMWTPEEGKRMFAAIDECCERVDLVD